LGVVSASWRMSKAGSFQQPGFDKLTLTTFILAKIFYSTLENIKDEQLPPKPNELLITWLTGIFVYD
jgi:hypothetical protein